MFHWLNATLECLLEADSLCEALASAFASHGANVIMRHMSVRSLTRLPCVSQLPLNQASCWFQDGNWHACCRVRSRRLQEWREISWCLCTRPVCILWAAISKLHAASSRPSWPLIPPALRCEFNRAYLLSLACCILLHKLKKAWQMCWLKLRNSICS